MTDAAVPENQTPVDDGFAALSLAGVVHRCTQESQRFFRQMQHDPRFCYELFRRAIAEQRAAAWDYIYAQYMPEVQGWVNQHPQFPLADEDSEFFANRAFEKMWRALPPDKFPNFPNLKSLLRYLQMCVNAVIVDHVRAQKPVVERAQSATTDTMVIEVEERLQRQEMWQLIDARLNNEKERLAIFGRYDLGLMPRQIHADYADVFASVNEVHRILQNVLSRLRRDDNLKTYLGNDD